MFRSGAQRSCEAASISGGKLDLSFEVTATNQEMGGVGSSRSKSSEVASSVVEFVVMDGRLCRSQMGFKGFSVPTVSFENDNRLANSLTLLPISTTLTGRLCVADLEGPDIRNGGPGWATSSPKQLTGVLRLVNSGVTISAVVERDR